MTGDRLHFARRGIAAMPAKVHEVDVMHAHDSRPVSGPLSVFFGNTEAKPRKLDELSDHGLGQCAAARTHLKQAASPGLGKPFEAQVGEFLAESLVSEKMLAKGFSSRMCGHFLGLLVCGACLCSKR